ncbi:MAG: hypothetical protein CYPHOPRED_001578 [Cyphobasidiales sp. Tagirdzhanova-0007]|nr:MAG: hypothetical protein CYPHOPRED_001578 [Cyphobasidiales sp. Tagirdzhanova-0007]
MFTPLHQGKESRIVEDDRLIVPGRFRAHAHRQNGTSSTAGKGGRARGSAPATPRTPTRRRRRRLSQRFRTSDDREGPHVNERTWLLRPSRERVETWLDAWWKRWLVMVLVPSCILHHRSVSDPYDPNLPWPEPGWNWSTPTRSLSSAASQYRHGQTSSPSTHLSKNVASFVYSSPRTAPPLPDDLPVDINFWFFLVVYYGAYLAVALIWVTCLFNLYRLNWWPRRLGGTISYIFFWTGALCIGTFIHYFDTFGIQKHRRQRNGKTHAGDTVDWERKTFWVSLAFATMSMPALVCFAKLRRDRRMTYRHSLTETQKTFLERQLGRRMPKSYIRFLWFLSCVAIALFSGLVGQAYMSVYLSTLPHGSIESVVYVWTWILSCAVFGILAGWILEKKVGSRALDFVFRLYFQLVYHVFYRTLFARLRKAEQFLYIQIFSSIWIVTFYPVWMSRTTWRMLRFLAGYEKTYSEHTDSIATNLYVRNLSENVTMIAFLGWLTILHFGPNRGVYPFFDFSDKDPYNYKRTAISSLIIWFSELLSSFVARAICGYTYKIDVTNTGLDTLREYPELLPACKSIPASTDLGTLEKKG